MSKPKDTRTADERREHIEQLAHTLATHPVHWMAIVLDEEGMVLGLHIHGLVYFYQHSEEDFCGACIQGPFKTQGEAERARDQMISDHKLGFRHEDASRDH